MVICFRNVKECIISRRFLFTIHTLNSLSIPFFEKNYRTKAFLVPFHSCNFIPICSFPIHSSCSRKYHQSKPKSLTHNRIVSKIKITKGRRTHLLHHLWKQQVRQTFTSVGSIIIYNNSTTLY